MQNIFEIEQGVPEIWGFKGLEMILLRGTKKRGKYHCACSRGVFHRSNRGVELVPDRIYLMTTVDLVELA